MTFTADTLRVGDRVASQGDQPDYEVAAIDAQQGRLQIADTAGAVHTYNQSDTVTAERFA